MTIDSVSADEEDEGNSRLTESATSGTCNGAATQAAASSSSNNVNTIRKTLAKWLRLQKSSQAHQGRARYKLIGWPPKWVRRRTHSPAAGRALPPVPQVASQFGDAEQERVETPELQPEDFPPGVAYLPEGEDDDNPDVFESKSDVIDFAASIETVKNVSSCHL